jgi:hypothetical protein
MAYLYKHIRLDKNEVFYIGIGSDDNFKRAYSKTGRNKHWKNITKLTDYSIEIISEEWLTWEEACEKEKFWITFYGRVDLGKGTLVNMTDGGEGQFNPALDTREKMSLSRKKRITKKSTREKISFALSGKKRPNMNNEKLIERNKSNEIRIKSKLRMSGNNNPNFGKSTWNSKKIEDIQTGIIFDSKRKAAQYFNVSLTKLTRLLNESIIVKYK